MRFPGEWSGIECPLREGTLTVGRPRMAGPLQRMSKGVAMASKVLTGFYTLVLTAFFVSYCHASPLSSKLLPLVPSDAEIVSGFEYQPAADDNRSLLLTTRNNRLDLDDWQALTGVDSNRVFDEVIEVASTGPDGSFSEHMLLVAGRFDRERIFRSIQDTGTDASPDAQQSALLIKPLARERGDMRDTRWLVILDSRIGILGTPWLVQRTMQRYAQHAVPDSAQEERLTLLRPDVTSWNVLAVSRMAARNILFGQEDSPWADLQRDTDVLMVAARFGSKVRIDFSIDTDARRGADFFTRKAEFFHDALKSSPPSKTTSPETGKRRWANLLLEPNRVQGSVELSSEQFEAWRQSASHARLSATHPPAHGD